MSENIVTDPDRLHLFRRWAEGYDSSVEQNTAFPFVGYADVLSEIVWLTEARPGMTILDLGTGTGNLAARFIERGCAVWGLDFSAEMLAKARVKAPRATLIQADLLGEWPAELHRRFDRVVSAYVFHEFDQAGKGRLVHDLTSEYLAAHGRIVIGDVAFAGASARDAAHRRWSDGWDESEHYWAADEAVAAVEKLGLRAEYEQVSDVGGVFVIQTD